jgi:hypothetical protein
LSVQTIFTAPTVNLRSVAHARLAFEAQGEEYSKDRPVLGPGRGNFESEGFSGHGSHDSCYGQSAERLTYISSKGRGKRKAVWSTGRVDI